MKILTGELLAAFRRVRWKYRSTAEMAKAMGVSASMMSRILRGKTSHISDRHWITMRCIVEPAWCGKPCEDVVGCSLRRLLQTILDVDPDEYPEIEKYVKEKYGRN